MIKRERGFTLIELLIVVAIIGILAAIAIPNFLEAQTRAKVAKAKSEIRNVAVALESYYLDNNSYPPACDENSLPQVDNASFTEDSGDGHFLPIALTAPIAHLSSLPEDPFAPDKNDKLQARRQYEYATRNLSGWILTSAGPNTTLTDIMETDYVTTDNEYLGKVDKFFLETDSVAYDPTNGTVSKGGVYRVGP